jgi:hypothetical protein
VDLEQHRELFRRLLRYQGPDRDQFGVGQGYGDPDLDSRIKEHKQRGYPYVSHTNMNITPYGAKTRDILSGTMKIGFILMYRHNECGDSPLYESNIYFMTEAPGVLDAIINAASPGEKSLRTQISPNNGGYTSVGMFRYRDIPYIDKYCLTGNKSSGCFAKDTLNVYKYDSIRNPKATSVLNEYITRFHKICEYRYLNK